MPTFLNYDGLSEHDPHFIYGINPNDLDSFVVLRGMNNRGYARFFGEEKVIEDMNIRGHHYPHLWPQNNGVVGQPTYGTDLNDPTPGGENDPNKYGFKLSYWLSYSEPHDPDMYEDQDDDDDLDYAHLDTPELCARTNVATNRTPSDLLLSICPEENPDCKEAWEFKNPINQTNFNDMHCLADVGEVFPLTAQTRTATSDYFFQTLIKGYKQYHSKYAPGLKSVSFDLDKDRFHIFPGEEGIDIGGIDIPDIDLALRNIPGPDEINDKLHADMPSDGGFFGFAADRCQLFDELESNGGRKPWDFKNTNKKDEKVIGSHSEATMEVFTMFSGCYGFVGKKDWTISPFPGIDLPGVFRLLPSYFPQIDDGSDFRVR